MPEPPPVEATRDGLREFADRGLAWIDAHLEDFDPFADGRPFEVRLGQRVGELAILLNAYVGLATDVDERIVARMTAVLERIQDHPEFVARLIRSPLEFILFAEVYANLRAVGRDDARMHDLIQRAIDAGFLEQSERFPNRMMDIRSCLDMGGFEADYPSLAQLYERSILSGRTSVLLLSQEDVYAITHVLMFLFAFGTRDTASVSAASRAKLERLLPGLLVLVGQEHHWDLMAELLICWDCLSLPESEVSERAWAELLKLQDVEGAIPGPEWAARLHEQLGNPPDLDADRELYFSHHYHTTLVCLIAAFLRLRRLDQAVPEPRVPARRERTTRTERVPAARDAERYLGGLTDRVLCEPRAQATVLGQLVLGHWLAAGLAGDAADAANSRITLLGARLAERDAVVEWADAPATQLLLVAALLQRHGVFVPYLHAQGGFVDLVTRMLRESQADDLALVELRVVLSDLVSLPAASGTPIPVGHLGVSATPEELDRLLDQIAALTACGTRPGRLGETWASELLAGVAAYTLRRYDFARGTRLLRAVTSLEPASEPARALLDDCVRFVYLNQRPDGAFGFIGPEARSLATDPEVTLSLPITVDCLWALAEAESNWRLFSSVNGEPLRR